MNTIRIEDATLSCDNVGKNLDLSFKEKLEIAKNLNALSVDSIELPFVLGNKSDEVLVKTLSKCIDKSVLSLICGNSEEELEKSFSLISGAKSKRLVVCVPVSPTRMEYTASKKPKAVLEQFALMLKKAKSLNADVEVSLDDATRAEIFFLDEVVKIALDNGVKIITINDLSGDMTSQEFYDFIKGLLERNSELKKVSVCLRVSDVLSLGVSNIISGILAGANAIKTSTCSGCVSLDKVVPAIDSVLGKKSFETKINKTALSRITERISSFVSFKNVDKQSGNFDKEKDEDITSITEKELSDIIRKRGYDVNFEDLEKIYSEFKRLSEKKRVNTKELDVIIATTALQVPSTYSLISFSVNTSNLLNATASVVLKKGDKELSGISFGNGAVDAAFRAIENAIGRQFDLDEFRIDAITEGMEAMGQTIVKIRSKGKIYSGKGVSTDIIGASIRAYVNAVNKIVYEE